MNEVSFELRTACLISRHNEVKIGQVLEHLLDSEANKVLITTEKENKDKSYLS